MKHFHWTPSVFAELDEYEKAFVVAAVDKITELEKNR